MRRGVAIAIFLGLLSVAPAVELKEEEVLGIAGFQHTGSLAEIICLTDGKHVLSSSRDGYAALWEIESGKLVRRFEKEGSGDFWGMRELPGGKEFVVGASSKEVIRFEIATGKIVETYPHSDYVLRVALHPDGKRFVGVDDDKIAILWTLEKGNEKANDLELGEVRRFKGHTGRICTAIFVEEGKYLVTGSSDGTFRVWDVETGECVKTSKDEYEDVYTLALSSDGSQFAMASSDDCVRVFDAKTRKEIWKVKVRSEPKVVAWSPDGKLVATAAGDFLYLFDSKNGDEVRKIRVAGSAHTPITFSNDGQMLISGGDQHLHLHEVGTGERIVPTLGIPLAPNGFDTFAVGPKGQRVYASSDEKLYIWNREERGDPLMVDEKETIYSVAASPAGEEFGVGMEGGELRLRRVETGELRSTIETGSEVSALVFSPTGRSVISGGSGGAVAQWDLSNGGRIQDFKGHTGKVTDVAVASNGDSFATASEDDSIRIWSLRRKAPLARLPLVNRKAASFAFLNDGKSILAAVRDKGGHKKEVWGRFLPEALVEVEVNVGRIQELLAKLGDDKFEVRKAATDELFAMGEEVLPHLEKIKVRDPEVSARLNGVKEMIIGGGDKDGMEVVHTFKSTLYHLAGDPTGRFWAAVVGEGKSARIVLGEVFEEEFKSIEEIKSVRHPSGVKFGADGKSLISSNDDGTLTVYSIVEE